MRRFNALTGELPVRRDRSGYAWHGRGGLAREMGLGWLGASAFELPAGEWTFPYHYHHGVEEWLYVVAGAPTLREPAGERVYPDSDKIGVRPPGGGSDRLDFRRADAVDYWDGE